MAEISFFSIDDTVDAIPVVLQVSVATSLSFWSFTGGPGVAAVKALWADPSQPSRFLAGSTGGLFLTENFGQQWNEISLGADVYSFQVLES